MGRGRKNNAIDGQWNARTIEMMESPAYRVLSVSAHRVLDRVCIELAHHGGNDNGKLPVTYQDFMAYGINRQAHPPSHSRTGRAGLPRGDAGRPPRCWGFPLAEPLPHSLDKLQKHYAADARMAPVQNARRRPRDRHSRAQGQCKAAPTASNDGAPAAGHPIKNISPGWKGPPKSLRRDRGYPP
jgi:hypothetical protein